MRSDEREKTGHLNKAMFRLYRIRLLFTHMNGDFSAISVRKRCCTASISTVESHVSDRCSYYTAQLFVSARKLLSVQCEHKLRASKGMQCSYYVHKRGITFRSHGGRYISVFLYKGLKGQTLARAGAPVSNTLMSGPNSLEQTALSAEEEVTASILSPLGIERRSMT